MLNRLLVLVAALGLLGLGVGAQQEQPTSSVWAGVFTEEQVARGDTAYRQQCANCHGDGLGGADMTPALAGGVFTSNWNDLTVGDLFERSAHDASRSPAP